MQLGPCERSFTRLINVRIKECSEFLGRCYWCYSALAMRDSPSRKKGAQMEKVVEEQGGEKKREKKKSKMPHGKLLHRHDQSRHAHTFTTEYAAACPIPC